MKDLFQLIINLIAFTFLIEEFKISKLKKYYVLIYITIFYIIEKIIYEKGKNDFKIRKK